MTRLGSLVFCAGLGVALLACGSNSPSGAGAAGGNGGGGTGGTVAGGTDAGPTAKTILDLVPRDNTVSGWTVDSDNSKTAGMVAATGTTEKQTEDLIDGSAADFFAAPNAPVEFAWQNYISSTVTDAPAGATVTFYILQMPSPDQAASLYSSLLNASAYGRKKGTPNDWVDPTSPLVGTDSRVQDTGTTWWINFYKGNFYVEVNLSPSQGPAPDFTPGDVATKTEAFRFAQAVAGNM